MSVVVENGPGGTGAVALDLVAKAPPGGCTLAVGFAGANVGVWTGIFGPANMPAPVVARLNA